MSSNKQFGRIEAIAIRTTKNGPMQLLDHATGVVDQGLAEDLPCSTERGLSLISKQQWETVQSEIGKDLPWHTRRANVLVDSGSLAGLIGMKIAIGELEMDVLDETRPCGLMDQIEPGLREVLKPDFRGGVLGRITKGGSIKPGDEIQIIGEVDK